MRARKRGQRALSITNDVNVSKDPVEPSNLAIFTLWFNVLLCTVACTLLTTIWATMVVDQSYALQAWVLVAAGELGTLMGGWTWFPLPAKARQAADYVLNVGLAAVASEVVHLVTYYQLFVEVLGHLAVEPSPSGWSFHGLFLQGQGIIVVASLNLSISLVVLFCLLRSAYDLSLFYLGRSSRDQDVQHSHQQLERLADLLLSR